MDNFKLITLQEHKDYYYGIGTIISHSNQKNFTIKMNKELTEIITLKINASLIKNYYADFIFENCKYIIENNMINKTIIN